MRFREGAFRRAFWKTGSSAMPSVLGLSIGVIISMRMGEPSTATWVSWGVLLLFFLVLPFCLYLFIRERGAGPVVRPPPSPPAEGRPTGGPV